MTAYYNEHDPFAAAWLRELIADGLVANGEVDERSIEDVAPDDVRSFQQCHWFAGIAVWSLAARLVGIPDDAPLWTGSCPCQPFSAAGEGGGFADERHLWPAFHYLVEQCGPPVVAGEQVAGSLGDAWLDLVQADLDATGYAFGAAETCAAGFGAPHIRTRNYWMAFAHFARLEGVADAWAARQGGEGGTVERDGATVRLADATSERRDGRGAGETSTQFGAIQRPHGFCDAFAGGRRPGPVNGLWRDADWLRCRDEKWRPVESGSFPLVNAGTFRNRVGLLRGAGNAVNLAQAAAFLDAVRHHLARIAR